jgi:hypothetical protein
MPIAKVLSNPRGKQFSGEIQMNDPNVALQTICAPSDDIVAREIEGEIVIVPLASGIGDAEDELYSLNETGQAIWKHLDGARTLGAVVGALAQEFDTPRAELEADVLGFCGEMVRRGILTLKDEG